MNRGFIALSSLLVVLFLVTLIGISTSLLSINDLQSSFSGTRNEELTTFVESCVEEALLMLNENTSVLSAIDLPGGSCGVTINSEDGTNWDLTISGSIDQYSKKIRIQAVRAETITVVNWKEVI